MGEDWAYVDGVKMRCGGPRLCSTCSFDKTYLDQGTTMPNVQTTRTTAMNGSGSGPTLADLRVFLDEAASWSDTSTVRLSSSDSQRDGSSWRIELTETSPARSQR